ARRRRREGSSEQHQERHTLPARPASGAAPPSPDRSHTRPPVAPARPGQAFCTTRAGLTRAPLFAHAELAGLTQSRGVSFSHRAAEIAEMGFRVRLRSWRVRAFLARIHVRI